MTPPVEHSWTLADRLGDIIQLRESTYSPADSLGYLSEILRQIKATGDDTKKASFLAIVTMKGKSLAAWIDWGKRAIAEGINAIASFYTPNIGLAIQASQEQSMDDYLPDSERPGLIVANQEMVRLLQDDPEKFRQAIENRVLTQAGFIYESARAADEPTWQDKMTALSQARKEGKEARILAGWGSVISNLRRVLALGEQPLHGKYITLGKTLCYQMATQGALRFMLPLGINVEQIKNDPDLHDAFFQEIMKVLDGLGIPLIQLEDLDGPSAFRILAWARGKDAAGKRNIEAAVFDDDTEGTAWAIWGARLAEKARTILLSNAFREFLIQEQVIASLEDIYTCDFDRLWPHLRAWLADESNGARENGILLFRDSLFFLHGGGGAATGTADFIREMYRTSGMTEDEANQLISHQILMTDGDGLMYGQRQTRAFRAQDKQEFKSFSQAWVQQSEDAIALIDQWAIANNQTLGADGHYHGQVTLQEAVEIFGPGLGKMGAIFLTGLSTQPGQFTEEIIAKAREIMDKAGCQNLNLGIDGGSNPTHFTEFLTREESDELRNPQTSDERKAAILEQAVARVKKAAQGRVTITTGSPFKGIPQLNNVNGAFPPVGAAVIFAEADQVTAKMGEAGSMACVRTMVANLDTRRKLMDKAFVCPDIQTIFAVTDLASAMVAWQAIRNPEVKIKDDFQQWRAVPFEDAASEQDAFQAFYQEWLNLLAGERAKLKTPAHPPKPGEIGLAMLKNGLEYLRDKLGYQKLSYWLKLAEQWSRTIGAN